jgi:hypothetical protein
MMVGWVQAPDHHFASPVLGDVSYYTMWEKPAYVAIALKYLLLHPVATVIRSVSLCGKYPHTRPKFEPIPELQSLNKMNEIHSEEMQIFVLLRFHDLSYGLMFAQLNIFKSRILHTYSS